MDLFPLTLSPNSNILVIGAGGGFDFVCGLPVALELESQGHTVYIGNYSFTSLENVGNAEWCTDHLLKVTADSNLPMGEYFPEVHLSRWYLNTKGIEKPIWCLAREGVLPTLESYNFLVDTLSIDTVICVDGGVDGIFRGDEYELGTPSMDSVSVIAAHLCHAPTRIYACTAFGIDGAESSLSHAQVLNRIADLVRANAMLGVSTLLKDTPVGAEFQNAVDFIHRQMQSHQKSTIVSSIMASMNGVYGNASVNAKTQERQLWISPLTALYWYFRADDVAKMKLFYSKILQTQTVVEVSQAIEEIRNEYGVQPHELIPV